MGYAGKVNLQERARFLRSSGLSLGKIQQRLGVSRSSVSLWTRDVSLTRKQREKLYLDKRTGALRGSIVAAENKKRAREKLVSQLIEDGKKEVSALSARDRFIAGVALYFAEGTKTDGAVCFSNSDARSVVFMMKWFREFFDVPEEKFRCSLYLHDNLDEKKAKKYWVNLTRIPLAQFGKTYMVKNRVRRFRKTKHRYGVCRVTVSSTNLHRRIMGQIEGLFQKINIPQ